MAMSSDNIVVAVRMKPQLGRDAGKVGHFAVAGPNRITTTDGSKSWSFDSAIGGEAGNFAVYRCGSPEFNSPFGRARVAFRALV